MLGHSSIAAVNITIIYAMQIKSKYVFMLWFITDEESSYYYKEHKRSKQIAAKTS